MVLFIQVEKLRDFLATMKPLIDAYQQGDYGFSVRALKWLEDAQELMSQLRLPEGGEMSALRGQVLKAGDVAQDDDGRRTRAAIRRACSAAAADALQRAEAVMRSRIQEGEERLGHFEEKLCEALTAATLVDAFPTPPTQPRQLWLQQVWSALSCHQSIRPTTVYLATSLMSSDRLYLLDKIMNRLFQEEMAVIQPKTEAPAKGKGQARH
ncbi:hypothetical protein [Gallaecimonas sp. GXIMD4217]|uniref:hypothetical protein n=1 Tax=Gallaecimonas sp. GXIMD4217 TaxID=3131927 RepID=UPI00311ABC41